MKIEIILSQMALNNETMKPTQINSHIIPTSIPLGHRHSVPLVCVQKRFESIPTHQLVAVIL